MLYARNRRGEKLVATRGVEGFCPGCQAPMVPKLGEIVVHHWAHLVRGQCAYWSGETDWHLKWKALFPIELVEVVGDNCRADVLIDGNTALEFQTKAPEPLIIRSREQEWPYVIWIVEAARLNNWCRYWWPGCDWEYDEAEERQYLEVDKAGSFTWWHASKRWDVAHGNVILDLGENYANAYRPARLFLIQTRTVSRGFGRWLDIEDLFDELNVPTDTLATSKGR